MPRKKIIQKEAARYPNGYTGAEIVTCVHRGKKIGRLGGGG